MNRISVFNVIWDKIENIVLSHIRESLNKNVSSNGEFNRAYKSATGMFIYGNLIEKHWLNELQSEDNAKAEKFLHILQSFTLQPVSYNYWNTIMGYIITLVIGVATSGILASITALPLFKIILWGVFAMIVASGILLPVFKQRQQSHLEDVICSYRQQLEDLRKTLTEIIL